MTKYKCEKCGTIKELRKATLIHNHGSWVAKESFCVRCNVYMISKPKEGMPNLIRTEETYSKK